MGAQRRASLYQNQIYVAYSHILVYIHVCIYIHMVYLATNLISFESEKSNKYFLVTFIKFDLSVDLMIDYKVSHLHLIEAND